MAGREPIEAPVGHGDPPQLVRPVDRGTEDDGGSVGGGDRSRRLAARHIRPHAREDHPVVPPGQVAAALRRGVLAVRREQPEIVPAAGSALEPMAERDDRLPVGQPGRPAEDRVGTGADPGDGPAADVQDVDVRAERQVGVAVPVRGERDPPAVGRPRGRLVLDRALGQPRRLAARHVDEPEMGDAVVDEAGPVEHVAEAVDEPVVRRPAASPARAPSGRAGGGRRRGSPRARSRSRPVASRRATIRTRSRRAAGPSGAAPPRRRAAAGTPGSRPRDPWRHWDGSAPLPRASGGRRGTRASARRARTVRGGHAGRRASAGAGCRRRVRSGPATGRSGSRQTRGPRSGA